MKIIEISNLSKKYHNHQVFENINITLEEGKCYLFLGSNGSGKSTFFKCLLGLVNPTKGTINKEKVTFGYIPEKIIMPSQMTVEDFLYTLGLLRGIKEKDLSIIIDELLKEWKMNEKKKNKIRELSKGMGQKLLIIQAIMSSPNLLIFDEVLNGLDKEMQKKLLLWMKKWKKAGKTILISSHYPEQYKGIYDEKYYIIDGNMINDKKAN